MAGCRSSDTQTATAKPDAAFMEARADASSVVPAEASTDARAADLDPTRRPLPSTERLLAPFRGTKARGFVALTNTDPLGALRTSVSLAKGEALDLARPVLVASFTKLWTAVAALRMVERGELTLDQTIKEALPELASRPWAASTIRELLTHTSLVPELDEKGGYYRRVEVDFSSPVTVLSTYVPRDWTEKRGIYKYRNSELALVGAILAQRSHDASILPPRFSMRADDLRDARPRRCVGRSE